MLKLKWYEQKSEYFPVTYVGQLPEGWQVSPNSNLEQKELTEAEALTKIEGLEPEFLLVEGERLPFYTI